jgi:hypothetical protein
LTKRRTGKTRAEKVENSGFNTGEIGQSMSEAREGVESRISLPKADGRDTRGTHPGSGGNLALAKTGLVDERVDALSIAGLVGIEYKGAGVVEVHEVSIAGGYVTVKRYRWRGGISGEEWERLG